jgi:L-rhamnose isomerase
LGSGTFPRKRFNKIENLEKEQPMERYESAKARYGALGIDTEKAIALLSSKPISIHCWQGDDVTGFDNKDGGAGNGIQTTGNYPGKARGFEELKADFLKAARFIPGKKRINLHACYAVFSDKTPWVDRDKIEFRHFTPWVEFAKANNIGIDFNPTCFSHPMVKDGLTLSSPDEKVRRFWIDHCKATRRIANEIGAALKDKVLHNTWIPDGYKDIPSDRLGPRLRLKSALDEIFAESCPNIIDSVESKVFAIGLESYTVGSNEFYMGYAASRSAERAHPGVYNLLDNGHFHPTEYVSDKIPALLPFFDIIPLHVTRSVRWDSDHVVLYDDELREIMKEIVRNDALGKVLIGLDFFDASINRIAAWVIGTRNAQKALLFALLQPHARLRALQNSGNFTEQMMLAEEIKTLPFGDVWEEYCIRQNVPANDEEWFGEIMKYEKEVLAGRV